MSGSVGKSPERDSQDFGNPRTDAGSGPLAIHDQGKVSGTDAQMFGESHLIPSSLHHRNAYFLDRLRAHSYNPRDFT